MRDRPLLEAQALSLSVAGLGPLQLSISAGEVLQITGESGSGKSSLLRCLAFLDAQATGTLSFQGRRVRGGFVPSFRQRVVYVPQTPPRYPLSVLASLELPFSFGRTVATLKPDLIEDLVERLRLPKSILKRPLTQVSGGEAQRLGLIRALVLEPLVLLLDEPTSALDARSAEAVFSVLHAWFEQAPRALVCVTHQNTNLDVLWPKRRVLQLPVSLSEQP